MSLAVTVEAFLSAREVPYSTRPHPLSTCSLDTAHAAHVDEDCVAKSVVLQDEQGFVLAVLPASRRLEIERLRAELRSRTRRVQVISFPRPRKPCPPAKAAPEPPGRGRASP